jgi:hypothetical protein
MCTADKLSTSMCRLSRNLGALTSWNPQGLSRPVQGWPYLYIVGDDGLYYLFQGFPGRVRQQLVGCEHLFVT